MELKPQTLTTPYLGSVDYCYSLVYPFCPAFFFSRFLDRYFTPLSYLLPLRICSSLKPFQFSPAPHLLSRCEFPPTWMSPAPAARQPPPLIPVPSVVCLHLLPLLCRFVPPFSALGLYPGPCWPLGGSPDVGTSVSLCLCLILTELSYESWHRPFLGLFY